MLQLFIPLNFNICEQDKGGLISESFSIRLKSPKK